MNSSSEQVSSTPRAYEWEDIEKQTKPQLVKLILTRRETWPASICSAEHKVIAHQKKEVLIQHVLDRKNGFLTSTPWKSIHGQSNSANRN
uniref:Uncharacterized protein n=1 Tax=Moniliophthora roreri TaxID=221103 RepID=A0A0W0FX15_MONRR